MPHLFPFSAARLITTTYTGTQTVTLPPNVLSLTSVSGRGGAGQPAVDGYYDPSIVKSAYTTSVQYITGNGQNTVPGVWRWENTQSNGLQAADLINKGGSGNATRRDFMQYDNGFDVTVSSFPFSNSVPGSAYNYTSDAWKFSGDIVPNDFAIMYTTWKEYGTYHPPQPATTGPSASGFGLTFPGGTGGPATTVTFTNVAINPGQSYILSIPSGGNITISYFVN